MESKVVFFQGSIKYINSLSPPPQGQEIEKSASQKFRKLVLFTKQPGFAIYVLGSINSHHFHIIGDKLIITIP